MTLADVLKIDLASQSFMRNPFPTLARMRDTGPVVQVRLPLFGKTWVATTHDAVSEVLKDDLDRTVASLEAILGAERLARQRPDPLSGAGPRPSA